MSIISPHNYHTSYPPHYLTIVPSSQRAYQYFYQISYEITKDSNAVMITPSPILLNAII